MNSIIFVNFQVHWLNEHILILVMDFFLVYTTLFLE